MMNDVTGWMWICPWTMKTVITNHKARNRHSKKRADKQETRNNLQSKKIKFLCKHHQQLGSNMK
eukprot:4572949-Ditylum_brightwellii.AAC.1